MGATRRYASVFSLCLAATFAAGCGGGGGSSAMPPVAPSGGTTAGTAPASLVLTIAIPSASSSSSAARRVRYVSAGTKSATIVYGAQQQTVNCTTMCSITLQLSTGQQSISARLFDQPNAAGNLLATGATTTNVVAGQQNVVSIAFGGVPAKLAITLGAATATAGAAAQIPVVVKAIDAAGFTIVGPEPYASALVLSSDDHSGATVLSTTVLASPNDSATIAYNGSAAVSAVHVVATVTGTSIAAPAATLTIAAASAAGSFPDHVRTHAYYGLNNINVDVPAAFMAAHVDIVEDDGYTAVHADAFKRAGGKMAIAYTDPSFDVHCPAPFVPPAGRCSGPMTGPIAGDESAYIHDVNGARVNRYGGAYFQYQEIFNVAAPSARAAYARWTASILAASPLLDGFEADDSGSPFTGPDNVLGSNLYYGFNAFGVEIAGDAQYIAGESAMLAAAGKQVMINGGDPRGTGPAYGGTFLDLPSVYGQQFEGSFNNGGGYLYSDVNNKFQLEENALISVMSHHKLAVVYPTGDGSPAHRLYAYAAWLLTYDPTYSAYETDVPLSDGIALWPETQLVPGQPGVTATDIGQLRRGGVYVREFGACAVAAQPIGPCAAVVNSSATASAALPALSIAYGQHVVLDPQSIYHGGKANVVGGPVTSLGPETAVILVR